MSDLELDALLERMPKIAEAVEKFSSEAIQTQAFQSLMRAFSADIADIADTADESDAAAGESKGTVELGPESGTNPKGPAKKASKKTATPKVKTSFSIDKALDLVSGGQPAFKAFVEAKSPASMLEKCLISVYWLSKLRTPEAAATIDQVYSCFKHMEWKVPNDLANTLQQAGVKGWLDSKKRDDLKVAIPGENHVEHGMPAEKQSGTKK